MSPILTGVIASGISGNLIQPFSIQGGYDALATVTVPSGGAASINISGIPSVYKHLQLRCISRNTSTGYLSTGALYLQFNNDTSTNYSFHSLRGDGSTASAYGQSSTGNNVIFVSGSTGSGSSNTDNYGVAVIDILDYSSSNKTKVVRAIAGQDANGSGMIDIDSGCWYNTEPITSVQFVSGTYAEDSQFALYGVR